METLLVSDSTIISNLRRTARKNLISSLSSDELNSLALKYFGISKNGELVGYMCPYSGQILTDTKDIVLEHIIPISSGGGTTLYNCIPTSTEVNKVSEKGIKNLISWWVNSKYWDEKAPERLEKILQYILEAYSYSFNSEQGNDFVEVLIDADEDSDNYEEDEADLSTTQEEEQEKNQSLEINYYGFIIDIINELKKYTDTSKYEVQLQNLVKQNAFNNVERQALIQNKLKEIIKNKLEVEDRSELSIVLNININLLTKSLEEYSDDKIDDILIARINNIEEILDKNNLSLDSFFSDKNCLIYLYKDKLTEEDINNLIEDINMSVNDKFNALIEFVIGNGWLPSIHSSNEKNKQLARFKDNMRSLKKNKKYFHVNLTKEQLEYLHNSEYESLREIYKVILNKAIENNVTIAYVDEQMKQRILEFKDKNTKVSSTEEQIELEREYLDVIIIKSQFKEFINFVLCNNGMLPSGASKDENEKRLGNYRNSFLRVRKDAQAFNTSLTKEQLEYLHNSKYESLREIYKNILYKAIENNIIIAYVDEQMKQRILEFKDKNTKISSIEEQIELEREYKDVIIIKSQFNEFINFVLCNNGMLPSSSAKDENEKKLGRFKSCIEFIKKAPLQFSIILTKEQLEYLHNSKYESLRKIYKVILNKAIENNVTIAYVDEQMKQRILEFKDKNTKVSSIEEQVELEREYSDVIIIKSQFNEFINFVINHGRLPINSNKSSKQEHQLVNFMNGIKKIDSKSGNISIKLTKEQLQYLNNSEYESLREIYKVIINKVIENNIDIEYVDEQMKQRILEFKDKNTKVSSIEEQIELEREYKDVIIIESQFNELINFVINNQGRLPSTYSKDEYEKKLSNFRKVIQAITKGQKFTTSLTKEQLEYLHNSEYESLREIYKNILYKAIENNIIIEYVDEEMVQRILKFKEEKCKIKSLEEQIELEREYKDVIIISNQFNEFINFAIKNNGVLPSTKSKDKYEKQLGRFRSNIQSIDKKRNTFNASLTKEQLEYLHNSEYESLREIYYSIMEKARQIDYQPYIEVDNELSISMKGRAA